MRREKASSSHSTSNRTFTLRNGSDGKKRLGGEGKHTSSQSILRQLIQLDPIQQQEKSYKIESESLRKLMKEINDTSLLAIDSIRPKKFYPKTQKERLLLSDRELQNSNRKIHNLHKEIHNLEVRNKDVSKKWDNGEIFREIQQVRTEKAELSNNLAVLRRMIESNGKELIQKSQSPHLKFFDLQKEKTFYDQKRKDLIKKGESIFQENDKILAKIRKMQSTIEQYEQQYGDILSNNMVNFHCNNDPKTIKNRQGIYRDKVHHINTLKMINRKQIKNLQMFYFKKIKDLQYEMDGCEAIDEKIIEVQDRILKNKNYIGSLKTYLSMFGQNNQEAYVASRIVKYKRSFSQKTLKSLTSEPTIRKETNPKKNGSKRPFSENPNYIA